MLFNSYPFLFLYLPLVLTGYFYAARFGRELATSWLTVASFFFYGYWNPAYIGLLLGSIVFNYGFGTWIARSGETPGPAAKRRLAVAVTANLLLLGYYKYANFFLENVGDLTGIRLDLEPVLLPLGISFFTFTQIAYLVDTYQGKVKEYNFVHYALFVTYFPHLVAGPILHHKEMMPQFAERKAYRFTSENLAVGSMIFAIGLFKKTVLADGIAKYVGPVFDAPAAGIQLTFLDAWAGALSYCLQLYFDFSGYSDMAIGLSRMFGVNLPLNFHSPYKAVNIIEFWRRWHMTLSRFLRDYLYIPLGGNRKGPARRHVNLMVTMLLGGLWHGAGWTFVIWGGLHGAFLVINHAWHALRRFLGQDPNAPLSPFMHGLSVLLTFLAVTVSWVFFRADNSQNAMTIIKAMCGMSGFDIPATWLAKWGSIGSQLTDMGFGATSVLVSAGTVNWIVILLVLVWSAPNTQQILMRYDPALDMPRNTPATRLMWQPSRLWLALHLGIAIWAVTAISQLSPFLYFQF